MLLRALLAFIACPGMVAYVVPLLLAPAGAGERSWQWSGALLVLTGTSLLLWCVGAFYVTGKGTLAPWSPPRELVAAGPYARSRNPMYIAVITILLGWSIWFASLLLLLYAAGVTVAFHMRVMLHEEPWLARTHGEQWQAYRGRVPRWL